MGNLSGHFLLSSLSLLPVHCLSGKGGLAGFGSFEVNGSFYFLLLQSGKFLASWFHYSPQNPSQTGRLLLHP